MNLFNLLRLDEDRILAEQLRLLLNNIRSTFPFDAVLSIGLFWLLANEQNQLAMGIWSGSLILSHFNGLLIARRYSRDRRPDQARRLARKMMLLQALEGAIWGSLTWVALGSHTELNSLIVLAVLAAALGANVGQLAAVLPVFSSCAIAMLLVMLARIWNLNDPVFNVLGALALMYVVILFVQAVNGMRSIRTTIRLRFENSALMEKLRIETELAETAKREAEHANAAKSKFLAAASHDLRQPIHAQGLFLEVLARTEQTPHQKALLASARAASEASGELLNALLDFSRIEAGVVKPQMQTFRLQPLLNKIEAELAPQADAKNLVYRSRETQIAVHSDPMLLELILRNLVTNAIRYTELGGILIGCRRRGNQALLEVWDTGIGIGTEHQKEVFREFHQLGNPERDRRKGLGLGLAIADGLARTLEHPLTLASKPGCGSVFRLTLPISNRIQIEPNPLTQSRSRVLNLRLLVIDDDEIVREGMLHLLRDWGCECDAAESIEEALMLARLRQPEVIISDYRLREQRTGVEAIEAVRAQLGAAIPALLITGDTAPERLREAQASGIPLLHKPVSPGMLYRQLVELQQETAQ